MVIALHGVSIETERGDISQVQADAVVNAANNHFWMGAGVAGALKRAGGVEIEREAMSKGPLEVGAAVVTGGGNLKAKYVIHAAVMGQDLRTDRSSIQQATRSSLESARELGVESIAFPAFGTGVGGFSPEIAADAMIGECAAFVTASRSSLKRIVFVLFSADLLNIFENRLEVHL